MASVTPAIERLQKKLQKEPNSLAFCQLADEYRKEGMHQEALKTCREGLRKHPNYTSAFVALGRIQYEMGDLTPATESLEKVIRIIPDNLLANRLLGDIYLKQGNEHEALTRYRVVHMLSPSDQEIKSVVRRLEEQFGMPEEIKKTAAAREEQVRFAELQPESTGELEETQEQEHFSRTNVEFAVTNPDLAMPEVPQQFEAEQMLVVEPQTYSPGDTFRLQEPAVEVNAPEIIEEAKETVEPPLTNADLSLPLEHVSPSLIDRDSGISSEEPDLTPGDERSHADQLADIASILLGDEDQKLEAVPAIEMPESDFVYEDEQSDDLEQVLEDAPQPARRDMTQPIAGADDTDADADELTTETLAELYVEQGSPERAIKVYQKLLLNDPENARIQQRLEELNPVEALIASVAQEAQLPQKEQPAAAFDNHHQGDDGFTVLKTVDAKNEERQRKISTLESWLASIRRER